ncbi:D-glycerate dehydrogenase [soil metagenome]
MTTARVLVTRALPAGVDCPPEWAVWPEDRSMPRDMLLAAAAEAEGLLCMLVDTIDSELLEAAPRLRVISQMAAGVDNVDVEAATAAGVPVGHTPGVLTETTADTAFALLAVAARRLAEGQALLRSGQANEWNPDFLLGADLHDTTLGVVGMGSIGTALGHRARGFRMRLLYSGPNRKPEAESHLGAEHVAFEVLMSTCDHVILTAPLTPDTYHMVDRAALESMRPGATLVNVARGGLIDHDALTDVAGGGQISVALDVTEPEPLPPDHPLLTLANVIVVPHLGSASVRTRAAMARLAIENLEAGLSSRRLVACVNPEVYEQNE